MLTKLTLSSPALPDSPYKFDTGVERNLTLTITKGLNTPFSMAFPDANPILITERGGKRARDVIRRHRLAERLPAHRSGRAAPASPMRLRLRASAWR